MAETPVHRRPEYMCTKIPEYGPSLREIWGFSERHSNKKLTHLYMLLKPNTIVVVLKGRFAGKKGVVVSASEDGRKILVAGIEKMPRPVTDDMPERKKNRLSRMSAFIKNYNSNHLLATRYRGDIGLGAIDFSRAFEDFESKKLSVDAVKKAFINASKQKKSAWLFEKLVF